jgi:hypothetical protein
LSAEISKTVINLASSRTAINSWLTHSFFFFSLSCPSCGADMRLVAFVTEPASVKPDLLHPGLPAEAPSAGSARGPPLGDIDHLVRSHTDKFKISTRTVTCDACHIRKPDVTR